MIVQYIFSFAFIVIECVIVIMFMSKAKKGKLNTAVRRIAGLDAIKEAVGRATEMGKKVHCTTGISMITDAQAPQTIAGLDVMGYVASLAATTATPLVTSMAVAETYPLVQETLKHQYETAGRPELYSEEMVRFNPGQWGWASAASNILMQEGVASNIMMGSFFSEALLVAEAGNTAGCIQVAGTAASGQLPFFVATCDYVLIGDELFAAGAYLSQDKGKIGTIIGQDWIKIGLIALTLIGVVLETFGVGFISQLLKF